MLRSKHPIEYLDRPNATGLNISQPLLDGRQILPTLVHWHDFTFPVFKSFI